jgi:hypothetical protein
MRERTRKGGLGWRVVDLARAARVRHDVAGGWLNGRTPDPYHLRPLAHALDVTLDELMAGLYGPDISALGRPTDRLPPLGAIPDPAPPPVASAALPGRPAGRHGHDPGAQGTLDPQPYPDADPAAAGAAGRADEHPEPAGAFLGYCRAGKPL